VKQLLAIALLLLGPAAVAEPFLEDPGSAFRKAEAEQRPLLVRFHATWCEACELMAATTWKDPGIEQRLERFVPLSVDGDRNRNLVARYSVDGYPTIVIAEPGGAPLLELRGLQETAALGGHLDATLARWRELAAWAEETAGRRPDPAALLGLAEFARERRADRQAERLYRRALRGRTPESDQARIGLAELLIATERCREAVKLIRKIEGDGAAGNDDLLGRAGDCAGRDKPGRPPSEGQP